MIDNQITKFISSLTRFDQGSIGMRKSDSGFYLDVEDTAEALRHVFSDLAAEKARADAAEAERNTFKAKDASKSKLLERFRDLLLNMCDHFEDEGDRVYFGSTNDPDELREIAQQMDAWKWDAIMGQTTSDPYADLREQRARAEKAEAIIASLTEQLARVTAERDSIADANHRQAHCIQLTAQALGPDYSATVDALPKAAKHVAEQLAEAREALGRMENCCEQLAATRSTEIYTAMIDGGQAQALLDLDNARHNARATLSRLEKQEGGNGRG